MNLIRAERISGMMPYDYLKWFSGTAKDYNRILEVGCFRGRTTTVFCDNCPGQVTAVDTWLGSPGLMEFIEFMQQETGDSDWLFSEFLFNMKDSANLEIVRMPSLEAAAMMQARSRQFDMIFIDALHEYEDVKADILAWLPLLAPGGMMCGHDFRYPDVAKAVREIFPSISGPDNSDMWIVTAEELIPQ